MTAVILTLSMLVSTSVFWQLRLTGITMAGDAGCGFSEHTHSDECYELDGYDCEASRHEHSEGCYVERLLCELGEHEHDGECYTETVVCEIDEHEHDENCTTETVLCELEAHNHGDECYAEVQLCEVPEHEHSDECVSSELTCAETVHSHSDECRTRELACEFAGHEHSEDCAVRRLVCERSEHIHSVECYPDSEADCETQLDWQAMVEELGLSGELREDVLTVARSQLGYSESERNWRLNDDSTRSGYTRYGDWYGNPYGDWSAMFVSFCLHYAGLEEDSLLASGANTMRILWSDAGLAVSSDSAEPGDLVFFADNTVGILSSVGGGWFDVIKGDEYDSVALVSVSAADVEAFASLPGEADSGAGDSDAGDSGAGESDAGESDASESDAGESDASESDAGESDASESDAGESDAGDSDAGDSGAGDSDAGDSGAGDSDAGDSGASDSDAGDSGAGDSGAGDSDAGDSDAGDSDEGDSGAGDSDASDSDAGDSGAGDSDAGDSGAGDSDAGDSDASDSGAGDSGTGDSGAGDSGTGDSGAGDSDSSDSGSSDSGAGNSDSSDSGSSNPNSNASDSSDSDAGDSDAGDSGAVDQTEAVLKLYRLTSDKSLPELSIFIAKREAFIAADDLEGLATYEEPILTNAREAFVLYDALTDENKKQISRRSVLEDYRSYLEDSAPEPFEVVADAIFALELPSDELLIGWSESDFAGFREQVETLRDSLEALPEEQRVLVSPGAEARLLELEAIVSDVAETLPLRAMLAALPELTSENFDEAQASVSEARAELDTLTERQLAIVDLSRLVALEEAIDASWTRRVEDVIFLIDALPPIDEAEAELERLAALNSPAELEAYRAKLLSSISSAREAYDALPSEKKALVSNYGELEAYIEWLRGGSVPGVYPVKQYTDATMSEEYFGSVSLTVEGELPLGAEVVAYPVKAEPMDSVDILAAFDINILVGGEKLQPSSPLKVTFDNLEPTRSDPDLAIFYYDDSGRVESIPSVAEGETYITFEVDHFSTYAAADVRGLHSIAEQGNPEAVQALIDSGFFTYWSDIIAEQERNDRSYARSRSLLTMSIAESPAAMLGDIDKTAEQIDFAGKYTNSESTDIVPLTVGKMLSPTNIENVFDIVLEVNTYAGSDSMIDDPDMAVVIVMDISNTMNELFGDSTRYEEAVLAAEQFIDEFAGENTGKSKVGYVAFNTSAHKIFDLSECATVADSQSLKNQIRTKTGAIISAKKYGESHERFTNIEAGLKMASDMLDEATNENKFIIFLSDGFPTTYLKNKTATGDYTGWDPYCTSGTLGEDGVFGDMVWGGYSLYGTSYSDKAAIRAREIATSIKNKGTTIFSIGIDVAGQNIDWYLYTRSNDPKTYMEWTYKAEVEGREGYFWKLDSAGNRIPNANRIVDRGNVSGTEFELGHDKDPQAFKDWLKSSIGSGYYYDSTDDLSLSKIYNEIFTELKILTRASNALQWLAEDPMPDEIEFLGFYDYMHEYRAYPEIAALEGESAPGAENTASYNSTNRTLSWDLKTSGFNVMSSDGERTDYSYYLMYRVRLKNELKGFVESNPYNTNGETMLTYKRIITDADGNTTEKEQKVKYQIPAVHGYLGELEFTKGSSVGGVVEGAEFTLAHDTDKCTLCRGDGLTSVPNVATMTATSGSDGVVRFERIPSGHYYSLTESNVPPGYYTDGSTYEVIVSYDEVTVNVTKRDGSEGTWNGTIVNQTSPELPSTGGLGTLACTTVGLAMTTCSALGLCVRRRRERRRDDS